MYAKEERLDPRPLRKVSRSDLVRRLDELIASSSETGDTEEQHSLLLDLRAHQIELEVQGRELREALRSLEVSRDRYARLFDLAPVGYAVFDAQGRILEVNLTAAQMLGRVRGELAGLPFSGFLNNADARAFLAHVRDVVGGVDARPKQVVEVRTRGSGGQQVLRLLSSVLDEDAGRACLSAVLDVTEEAEAKWESAGSDRLRLSILDALPAEVAVLDRDGRIVAVNHGWRLFVESNGPFGESSDGLGLDYIDACRRVRGVDAGNANRISEGLAAVIARRIPSFSAEYPCPRQTGDSWFALTAVPLDHEIQGAVVVHWDTTDQRRAEAAARRARENWAQAARLNAVGILAASLVHELTQPLSAARFFGGAAASLLDRGQHDPERFRESLLGVETQIERAAAILQRLREFVRQRTTERAPVSIDGVILRAVELVRWFARDKRVALNLEQSAPAVLVDADSLQLEQVLINLVCNSIQAIDDADAERREVSIRPRRRAHEVEVTVRDTGPGIPPELGERPFDIFESAHDFRLGMGLAISREIVEAHGGKLWADPDAAQGAVLHFTLPIAAQELDE